MRCRHERRDRGPSSVSWCHQCQTQHLCGGRSNYDLRLTLVCRDRGHRTSAYLRASNGDNNSTLQYVGIVQKTAASDQTLQVQVGEGVIGYYYNQGDQTAWLSQLCLIVLRCCRLPLAATRLSRLSQPSPLMSSNLLLRRPAALSHLSPEQVTVTQSGDYLCLQPHTSRTSGTGRDVPRVDWRLDGLPVVRRTWSLQPW